MLKDDLQACLVSGYSFIGCSKFDQVDGYFGPGATKCHYRGVAEIALHKRLAHSQRLAQGACKFAQASTRGFHKGLEQGLAPLHRLAQRLAHLHKRLQPREATERHLR